ncbi:MAG: thymidine phosphorylase [Acidobacteria bacterium]|nr:thymidine phosphorylase [Acidobacteriota bacterium]MBI3662545.1 thymidine phosphorylase [Acidobacteriota bacterium]
MRIVDLIRRKRDSGELTREEIQFLVSGCSRGEIPDYQISAWLMATLIRGMTRAEIAALTEAMLYSGEVLDLSALPGKKVDKHSTGGVGDKTSLVIAPAVAAAGLYVPMISGRGLGHTGGTLDKLESIPGFNVNLSLGEFRRVLAECGCALIGQTAEIAPADKKLYALRDVTGTVESSALICGSIMSKKLAEGIDVLVLDVKTGSGAFMKREEDAVHLAELMVDTGVRMGKRVVALITDMDQPLGRYVGNALEIEECIHVMRGESRGDLYELCIELSAWMFLLGDRVATIEEGKRLAAEMISSGRALEKFREIVRLQGGDPAAVDDPLRLPKAKHTRDVMSPAAGYISAIACEQIGVASCVLGGGREKKEDSIDPAVGVVLHKKRGDRVVTGGPLCTIHYNSDARLDEARRLIELAYRIEPEPPRRPRPLVHGIIGGK